MRLKIPLVIFDESAASPIQSPGPTEVLVQAQSQFNDGGVQSSLRDEFKFKTDTVKVNVTQQISTLV